MLFHEQMALWLLTIGSMVLVASLWSAAAAAVAEYLGLYGKDWWAKDICAVQAHRVVAFFEQRDVLAVFPPKGFAESVSPLLGPYLRGPLSSDRYSAKDPLETVPTMPMISYVIAIECNASPCSHSSVAGILMHVAIFQMSIESAPMTAVKY